MGRPYSNDLRERVVAAVEGGLSRRQAAARFGVAISTAIDWVRRFRETGSLAPLRGWAPRGHRIKAKVPNGHWKTMTFLAALRHDRINAPCVFDGPINGERFLAYVEQFLAPVLKPGDIVIMDNLNLAYEGENQFPFEQAHGRNWSAA